MDANEIFFVPREQNQPAEIGFVAQMLIAGLRPAGTVPAISVCNSAATIPTPPEAARPHQKGQARPLTQKHRTVSQHNNGLSAAEQRRMSAAAHMLTSTGLRIWWFTLGDELLDLSRADAFAVFDKFTRALVRWQKRAGLPAYWFAVLETSGGLHFNVVAICAPEIAASLRRSFSRFMKDAKAAQEMWDERTWARGYGAKEATQESRYGREHLFAGQRLKGSHKLIGGGDRVRLSQALKSDGIDAKIIEPWDATHTRRTETRAVPKPYRLRRGKSPEVSGQLALLPLKEANRLRQFHGGHMTAPQAREAEYQRERIGLSQYQIAAAIGCSQPHYANVIRGHDPLSRIAAFRLRQVLLGEMAA